MNAVAPIPPDDASCQSSVLDATTGFAQIATEWQELSLTVARPSCFAAPSYFQAWRDTLSGDVSPLLMTVRRAGRLVGVMPLMRAKVRRGPLCAPRHDFTPSDRALLGPGKLRPLGVRQLSPIVSMPAAWVAAAPLSTDTNRLDVIKAMAGHIATLPGWDSFAVPVDESADQGPWLAALHEAGLRPWVHLLDRQIGAIGMIEPFAAKVARQNRNYRRNIRRAQSAAELAGLEVVVFEGREAVTAQLPALAAVAQGSWKRPDRAGAALMVPYAGRQQQFIEHLLMDVARDGDIVPVLSMATCDGQPVAAALSLLHGDRLTGLLIFHNDRVPAASPGVLVLARLIDWAHEKGLAGFDLNTTHEWTRHLADEFRSQNVIVAFAPTLRGRALELISAATRRAR